jgi:hypothetical protein
MSATANAYEPSRHVPASVDALLELDHATLDELYKSAGVPRVEDVAGDLKGRMLAIPALEGTPRPALIRRYAGSSAFPWRGKSFTPTSADAGEGKNRVFVDRLKLFRFTTAVGPSRAGPFDALQLDYDHAENPGFIRRIEDEIRELRPGLWLGQAWFRVRPDKKSMVVWFGLEAR